MKGGEGQQGSIAKRWLRRTRATVEGKIESRGVGQVFPVGGKPGARAQIAHSYPQGRQRGQVGKGLQASYWPRRMRSTSPRIDSDPYHSRTGGLNDVERKARSEAQARGESGTGTRGCRFVVAGGWCLGRDKRSAGGGPASSNDHAESRDHPRRGRAFRRQPVDLLCLRQRERQVSAW